MGPIADIILYLMPILEIDVSFITNMSSACLSLAYCARAFDYRTVTCICNMLPARIAYSVERSLVIWEAGVLFHAGSRIGIFCCPVKC